jgi:ABC-type sulfate transport system permease component
MEELILLLTIWLVIQWVLGYVGSVLIIAGIWKYRLPLAAVGAAAYLVRESMKPEADGAVVLLMVVLPVLALVQLVQRQKKGAA